MERDLSMPTLEDAEQTHPGYARWRYALPLPNPRMMLHVGAETAENFFVVADAWAHVLCRFIEPESHVVDVGCGCGRTARLLALNPNMARYTGLDVVPPYIAWCRRYFGELYGERFHFHHLDVHSERYNPEGALTCETATFPIPDGDADLCFAASLFTHLYPKDAEPYAAQIRRILRPGGRLIVSIHDQPEDFERFSGSEHRADYDPTYFLALMAECGFDLVEDIGDLCGQRTFVLSRSPG